LIKKDLWHGATVLISAMSTSEICQPGIPMVILHGTLDGTNPISRVKRDILYSDTKISKLIELEDNHSLNSCLLNDTLKIAILDAFSFYISIKSIPPVITNSKPKPKQNFNPMTALLKDIKKK